MYILLFKYVLHTTEVRFSKWKPRILSISLTWDLIRSGNSLFPDFINKKRRVCGPAVSVCHPGPSSWRVLKSENRQYVLQSSWLWLCKSWLSLTSAVLFLFVEGFVGKRTVYFYLVIKHWSVVNDIAIRVNVRSASVLWTFYMKKIRDDIYIFKKAWQS